MNEKCIAIFDSGIGGKSLLEEAKKQMPNEKFLYICDEENMPYGEKSNAKICSLVKEKCLSVADKCKAILLACNTATGVCISKLRQIMNIPIVGVEPAISKARMLYKTNILVLATTATIRQKNFANLLSKYGRKNFLVFADKNLANIVEKHYDDKQILFEKVAESVKDYPKNCSCIVLGCTHYVLIKDMLSHILQAPTVDGNAETIKQLKKVVNSCGEQ